MHKLAALFLWALIRRAVAEDSRLGRAEVELPLENVTKFAFGSCNQGSSPQPLWKHIEAEKPGFFLWLGDAVYGDNRVLPLIWRPNTIEAVREKYAEQARHPEYSKFLASGTKVLGIWDDHDYGLNDGGRDYKDAPLVQQIFLDFLKEPADSVRRQRNGLYTSYLIHSSHGKTIKLILLDVRSQLDRATADVLGAEQWQWLEAQLQAGAAGEADMMIVTSGMQVISDTPTVDRMERHLKSRTRLLDLIGSYPKVVLLSGDVHYAEVNCWKSEQSNRHAVHELTSSGMTHTCLNWGIPPLDKLCHLTLELVLQSKYRVSPQLLKKNFGTLEFDWQDEKGKVTFNAHSADGVEFSYPVTVSELSSTVAKCPPVVSKPQPVHVFWFCFAGLFTGVFVTAYMLLHLFKSLLRATSSMIRGSPSSGTSKKVQKKRQ
ncbi:uncharacterized protein LOC135817326 [Sycon ciliatum]|uniref:uncharacterized protein LOC135817326 n=1 Tax=Sycon ciliatum TaxID=27933 RepID=UPI0031F65A5F